jgi:hypothetical protein
VYLRRIEEKHSITESDLDDILRTHLITPEHLRTDDFEAFFKARIDALASLVGDAIGKRVVSGHGTNEPEREVDDGESVGDEDAYLEAV